jgi:hypothetical protein
MSAAAGSANVAATEMEASADTSIVRLFHQGELTNGEVAASRSLSTSTSSNLSHYNPQGQLHEFQVPRGTLQQWFDRGVAQPYMDMHQPTGIITPEIRIMPPASGQMNQFLIKP